MSERLKYTLNGIYKCENLEQYVENDNCPYFYIGYASRTRWEIRIKIAVIDGETVAYPSIYNRGKPKTQVRVYFNILKKDGSSAFKCEFSHTNLESDEACRGLSMNLAELLNEENGYLDDGTLTVEYGFHVESEEGPDGIWIINISDELFDRQARNDTFEFATLYGSMFSHKQIIKLHSNTIDANKNSALVPQLFDFDDLESCVQMTHGVRIQTNSMEYRNLAKVAFHLGFSNAVRYCEEQLIKLDEQSELKTIRKFKTAVKYNLRSYLVLLLKHIKTKKLIKILRRLDVEKMSSESMKAIVAKLFF